MRDYYEDLFENESDLNPRSNPDILPDIPAFKESTLHKSYRRLMDKAVKTLDGRKADVYFLYYKEGLTENQIADRLSITQASVAVYLKRAFDQIKAFCEINKGKL